MLDEVQLAKTLNRQKIEAKVTANWDEITDGEVEITDTLSIQVLYDEDSVKPYGYCLVKYVDNGTACTHGTTRTTVPAIIKDIKKAIR